MKQAPPTRAPRRPRSRQAQKIASWVEAGPGSMLVVATPSSNSDEEIQARSSTHNARSKAMWRGGPPKPMQADAAPLAGDRQQRHAGWVPHSAPCPLGACPRGGRPGSAACIATLPPVSQTQKNYSTEFVIMGSWPRCLPPPVLGLLAHDLRWAIVGLLAEGDLRTGELVARTGQAPSLVSYHLGRLRDAGLVSARRSTGRWPGQLPCARSGRPRPGCRWPGRPDPPRAAERSRPQRGRPARTGKRPSRPCPGPVHLHGQQRTVPDGPRGG